MEDADLSSFTTDGFKDFAELAIPAKGEREGKERSDEQKVVSYIGVDNMLSLRSSPRSCPQSSLPHPATSQSRQPSNPVPFSEPATAFADTRCSPRGRSAEHCQPAKPAAKHRSVFGLPFGNSRLEAGWGSGGTPEGLHQQLI